MLDVNSISIPEEEREKLLFEIESENEKSRREINKIIEDNKWVSTRTRGFLVDLIKDISYY